MLRPSAIQVTLNKSLGLFTIFLWFFFYQSKTLLDIWINLSFNPCWECSLPAGRKLLCGFLSIKLMQQGLVREISWHKNRPCLAQESLISVIWQNLTCVKSSLSCLPPLSSQILEFRGKEKHRREEERYKKRGRDGDQKKKKKHRAGVPVFNNVAKQV